jgi:hypothetical protein
LTQGSLQDSKHRSWRGQRKSLPFNVQNIEKHKLKSQLNKSGSPMPGKESPMKETIEKMKMSSSHFNKGNLYLNQQSGDQIVSQNSGTFPPKRVLDANQLIYGFGTQIIDENDIIDAGIKKAMRNNPKLKEEEFLMQFL